MRIALLALPLWLTVALAAEPGTPPAYQPPVAKASEEAKKAIARFRLPAGWKAEVYAAEPMLANPVCFCFDHQGRCYVAESFRIKAGVLDIRWHMDWLDDMLACRTVDDHVAFLKRRLSPEKVKEYSTHHERVRRLVDSNRDGMIDQSTVFADGFNQLESGIGAGLLARDGKVWYACIPDLWLLEDPKQTGRATTRKKLHTGYGVHIAFYGHDLHGLRMGPDGKLYYSIGDRGANVRTPSGDAIYPDEGVVFRCNPDGTDLEVVHRGLRNPQELAFDEFGNLFTGDNNCDAGDEARWVQIVEGGDSGWRLGYQYPTALGSRGPWMAESLWKPRWDGQPAHIVPPLANLGAGPSGLAYYPGVGLPKRYNGHFFLCDFRGAPGISGIRSFAHKPRGATFEVIDSHEAIWSVLATDVDFAPDGGLYVLDWVDGWDKTGKGRIYRITDPESAHTPLVAEVKRLLAAGFDGKPETSRYLAHADQRVRQEAQFAMAAQGEAAIETLTKVARSDASLLARIHALWGLGQIGRKSPSAFESVTALLTDPVAEVRAQAAKVLGDGKASAAVPKLLPLLKDAEPRVRFLAALALGRVRAKEAFGPAIELLRENADRDAYLRHAGVMALAGTGDGPALAGLAKDSSSAVRLGALLALRRLGRGEVAGFLNDADPRLVLEAARAIGDEPNTDALPALAALVTRPAMPELLAFRVANAHYRLGKASNAEALAALAGRDDVPEKVRVEAVTMLGQWAAPPGRDRVMGLWRPLAKRDEAPAQAAFRARLPALLAGPAAVRQEATRLAARFGIREVGPLLLDLVKKTDQPSASRIEALRALTQLKDSRLDEATRIALASDQPDLRGEGRRALSTRDPIAALILLDRVLLEAEPRERQQALRLLGEIQDGGADFLLARELEKLTAGKLPPETHLDLLDAAGRRQAPAVRERLNRFESTRPKGNLLAAYRESLIGGDAENGKRLFLQKAEVSCLRCHKVRGEGGEVGPDLTGIGAKQTREYLLESLILPNQQIAKGFETTILGLANGTIVQGVVKSEDAKLLRIMTAEGKLLEIKKDLIDERQVGKSAMPEDVVKFLSKREVRDLVEFLASLREPAPPAKTP